MMIIQSRLGIIGHRHGSVLNDWVCAQEMIPLASRTHLDVVGREGALATPNSSEVSLGYDAPARGWQTRPKDVEHFHDLAVMADRTPHRCGFAALTGIAHELALGVAHLGPGCFAGLVRHDRAFTRQAIVDRATSTVGRSLHQPVLRHTPYRTGIYESLTAGIDRFTNLPSMSTWTRYTTAGAYGQRRPITDVELGPGDVAGLDRKLLGDVSGLRVLDLGCGAGHSAVALAAQGARVVAIDADESQVTLTRETAEREKVHVEVHHADLADLAFLHADIFDAVIAVHSLAAVADLGRVFRQTHRLLKPDRPIVLTLPHPAALMVTTDNPKTISTSYADPAPLGAGEYLTHRHGIGHVFTQLNRANYRIDTLMEPASNSVHPASAVFRARKIGS